MHEAAKTRSRSKGSDEEVEVVNDSFGRICEDLTSKKSDETLIEVIQQVIAVFRPGQGFFEALSQYGSPAKLFEELMTNHELQPITFVQFCKAIEENTTVLSFSRNRSRTISDEPQSKKHGTKILTAADEATCKAKD